MSAAKVIQFRRTLASEVQSQRVPIETKSLDPWSIEPFVRVPLAIALLGLTANSALVYMALCFRWWKGSDKRHAGITIASVQSLADEVGLTYKETRKATIDLQSAGWIAIVKRGTQSAAYVAREVPKQTALEAVVLARRLKEHAAWLGDSEIEEIRAQADLQGP